MILCIGDLRSRVGRCAARTSSRTVCSVIYAWRRGFRRTTRCARSESSSTKACWSCRRLSASFMREGAGRPERLLRALLLQALYTVRSERLLMEQLEYNLLFRWFVGLSMDDVVWDATVFCKNRDRLLDGYIARKFMTSVLNLPQVRGLLS